MPPTTDFLVRRSDLREMKFEPAAPLAALQPDQVLLTVDQFAFTSNNITYGVFGDAMAYWNFFPAPEGWGRIPVWGFASVTQSRHADVAEGERVFGYLPMSTHLIVQPGRVAPANFMDMAAHRANLPAAYQFYRRTKQDPAYDVRYEDQQALLTPLFMTSFLIADFLKDHVMFGAQAVLLSSASSKTALGVAFQLRQNPAFAGEIIGLTSPANVAFCKSTGYYDRVLPYAELTTLPESLRVVYVDMAGNGQLLHDVHNRFTDHLKYSCLVGGTHWEQRGVQQELPGAKPQFFFAPAQIKKRNEDWGPGEVDARFARAWQAFRDSANTWLRIVRGQGEDAVLAVYEEMLAGRIDPRVGHILSLQELTP